MHTSRRAFLSGGSMFLLARGVEGFAEPAATFGLITDLHYADKPPSGTRHYRETLAKIREAIDAFRDARAQFVVELGDFIDEAPTADEEAAFLAAIDAEYRRFGRDRHYVLGNHCVWTLSKQRFLKACGAAKSYYSFDRGGLHFVVLDACFRRDGVPYGERNFDWKDSEIPPEEREWLARDLASAARPAIVFVHQRLDAGPPYGVASAAEVRRILERSGKVAAVFQGHHHRNDHTEIAGIHYCTLPAMVEGSGAENSAYALVAVDSAGSIRVDGFRLQQGYRF